MEELTIKEAKAKGIIPDFLHTLREDCPECGHPIMTTKTLTQQWCSNPRCVYKLAAMSTKIVNNFGCIGVGTATFLKLYKSDRNIVSPLAFLVLPEDYIRTYCGDSESTQIMNIRNTILGEKYTFAEVVSKLGLPELETRALTIFRLFPNYQTFKEIMKDLHYKPQDYIKNFPGFGEISAANIVRTLEEFEHELMSVAFMFKLRRPAKTHLVIAITEETHFNYMTKAEFMKYLNRIGRDKVHIELTGSALQSCDYIVNYRANEYLLDENGEPFLDSDGEPVITPGTIKKNVGIERNKKEKRKVLVTPDEMADIVIEILKEVS